MLHSLRTVDSGESLLLGHFPKPTGLYKHDGISAASLVITDKSSIKYRHGNPHRKGLNSGLFVLVHPHLASRQLEDC